MGNALKIKNVDFSAVSLARVSYIEPIPCTGIVLDANVLTFTQVDETKTLVATLTPSDTTDNVTWASSDDNIATVSDGVVTIHGIGTATITATCGEYSATASIVQTQLIAPYTMTVLDNKYPSAVSVTGGQVLGLGNTSNQNTLGQPYHAENVDLHISSTTDVECIRVPYGATTAKVKTSDDTSVKISYLYICDTTQLLTRNDQQFPAFVEERTSTYSGRGTAVQYGQCIVYRPTAAQTTTLQYVFFE